MKKFYTGVGSRETPKEMQDLIEDLAVALSVDGWTMRSGGAAGADSAFERGVDSVDGDKEIYIPWHGFNERHSSDSFSFMSLDDCNSEYAFSLASSIHPAWDRLSKGAKKLHARNVFQVLGSCNDIQMPSSFLVCWAKRDKHGFPVGGTRTAWVLASSHGIPCYNLIDDIDRQTIMNYINKDKNDSHQSDRSQSSD